MHRKRVVIFTCISTKVFAELKLSDLPYCAPFDFVEEARSTSTMASTGMNNIPYYGKQNRILFNDCACAFSTNENMCLELL